MNNSYLTGTEYGYDQISINSDEYYHTLKTLDTNSINKIPTIREREMRVFHKMNIPDNNIVCDRKPDLFSPNGVKCKEKRDNIRKNIEEYYHDTNNGRIARNMLQTQSRPCTNNYPHMVHTDKFMQESMSNKSDMEYLINEMSELEKKNNMFLMFIYFLILVIIIRSVNRGSCITLSGLQHTGVEKIDVL